MIKNAKFKGLKPINLDNLSCLFLILADLSVQWIISFSVFLLNNYQLLVCTKQRQKTLFSKFFVNHCVFVLYRYKGGYSPSYLACPETYHCVFVLYRYKGGYSPSYLACPETYHCVFVQVQGWLQPLIPGLSGDLPLVPSHWVQVKTGQQQIQQICSPGTRYQLTLLCVKHSLNRADLLPQDKVPAYFTLCKTLYK